MCDLIIVVGVILVFSGLFVYNQYQQGKYIVVVVQQNVDVVIVQVNDVINCGNVEVDQCCCEIWQWQGMQVVIMGVIGVDMSLGFVLDIFGDMVQFGVLDVLIIVNNVQ